MAFEKYMFGNDVLNSYMFGGAVGALVAVGILIALLVIVAFYIYFAYSWMTIARKLKYKNYWLAWIPFANLAMIFQIGGIHWAWIFLLLVPFLGWIAILILLVISTWKIFETRNYPGWFSLSMIIPKVGMLLYLIALGFVAYKDGGSSRTMAVAPARKATKKITKKKRR